MLMMMNKLFRLMMEALNKVFGTRLSNNKIFCIILDLEHILFYGWSSKVLYDFLKNNYCTINYTAYTSQYCVAFRLFQATFLFFFTNNIHNNTSLSVEFDFLRPSRHIKDLLQIYYMYTKTGLLLLTTRLIANFSCGGFKHFNFTYHF